MFSHKKKSIGIISSDLFPSIFGVIFAVKLLLSHNRYYKWKIKFFTYTFAVTTSIK